MRSSLLMASVLVASSFTALADTVYTYTGQELHAAGLPVTDSYRLSGEFATATPFTPNAWTYNASFLSFAFTDGTYLLASYNNSGLHGDFFADATGQIVNWEFNVFEIDAPVQFYGSSDASLWPPYYDADIYAYNSLYSGFSDGPGSFTQPASPTPEPPALLLLGTGLIGAFGALRRRRMAHS